MTRPRTKAGFKPTILWLCTVVLCLAATGATPSTWTQGTPAANTGNVLAGLPEPVEIALPPALEPLVQGPTFLVYFSPGCPHCRDAQAELNDVSRRLPANAQVIGIASGRNTAVQVDKFRSEFQVPYPIVIDTDGQAAAAMRARSTPSVLYVERKGKRILAKDAWYPFRRGTGTLLVMRAKNQAFAGFDPGKYHGNNTCGACHTQEMSSWMLSLHSVAWDTLIEHNATDRPECVTCHVTGGGAPSGWQTNDASTGHLVHVGCESCHGPGGPHDGARTDPRSTCNTCHDPKHSIAFSVEKGIPHIDHFVSAALSEDEFVDRLRKLHTGQREKPLLAFNEAPHVGSESCKSCHSEAYAWWKTSDHATAMQSLSSAHEASTMATPSNDPTCVRCHASPTMHGREPSDALADYRTQEGVGCESCHGPGGEHVKAGGGKDNIEGLGEDCPVCVLESLCTSCHTQEWDPGWVLDQRLQAIQHGPTTHPGTTKPHP